MERCNTFTRRALIAITTGALLLATGCSSNPETDASHLTYPPIKYATYTSDGDVLIESYNVVRSAITDNRWLPLNETNEINQQLDSLFPELEQASVLSFDDLAAPQFHQSVEKLVKSFSCELYASQQSKDSVQACPPSNEMAANGLNYLPFHKGARFEQRLTIQSLNSNQDMEMDLFLKSGAEKSLESLWGAVHTLGQFNSSTLSPNNLVLTVNLNVHKKSNAASTWQPMHRSPLIFFVALPTVEELLAQNNEITAMQYAYEHAKLLMVDSR